MQTANQPIAILVADLHLSLAAPARRDPDTWMKSMAEHLRCLKSTARKHSVPILCAGDIFDRWKVAPELVNFAIKHLPTMYAIPGQHDLPYHDLSEIERSAFHTLQLSGTLLPFEQPTELEKGVWITPCPFGAPIRKFWNKGVNNDLNILVIHAYCWQKGASYPGAPPQMHISKVAKRVAQYDVAVFGDNHIGFEAMKGDCRIINCGAFINRAIDQRDYAPSMWMLHRDGSVYRWPLDTSNDKWREFTAEQKPDSLIDMTEFLEKCRDLGGGSADFNAIIRALANEHDITAMTRRLLLAAIGEEEMET